MGVVRCVVLGSILASTLHAGCAGPEVVAPVVMHEAQLRVLDARAEVSRTPLAPGRYVGVAIEPSGRRLALIEAGQVLSVTTGETVWSLDRPPTLFGFTDWASLGDGSFAVTAMSDGFLLDAATGILRQHFCYEPGSFNQAPGNPVQVSWAVGLAPGEGRLYAQPVTIEQLGGGAVTGSFIASYERAGGADLMWWQFPDASYRAGGLVVLPGDGSTALLLGSGSTLARFETASGVYTPLARLEGVVEIAGLAIDSAHQTLLVLDSENPAVIEFPLDALGVE